MARAICHRRVNASETVGFWRREAKLTLPPPTAMSGKSLLPIRFIIHHIRPHNITRTTAAIITTTIRRRPTISTTPTTTSIRNIVTRDIRAALAPLLIVPTTTIASIAETV